VQGCDGDSAMKVIISTSVPPNWRKVLPDARTILNDMTGLTVAHLQLRGKQFPVSVLLSDDEYISVLNEEYRQKKGPTNVLSFPYTDLKAGESDIPDTPCIGELVFALETIVREAAELGDAVDGRKPSLQNPLMRDVYQEPGRRNTRSYFEARSDAVDGRRSQGFVEWHFAHLTVHGILHLLGYDHELGEREAEEMERLEIAILAERDIPNPYENYD
jgi:probable rRNA maturation factor